MESETPAKQITDSHGNVFVGGPYEWVATTENGDTITVHLLTKGESSLRARLTALERKWREAARQPSHSEFSDGRNMGYENCADDIAAIMHE